jgi:hypothetical protein
MKIALIRCSANLNIGNEFINAGGEILVKKVFKNSEFFKFEFFDSAIPQNYQYPSCVLLESNRNFIENNCDLMIVFGGSIVSKYTTSVLNELASIKVKKILLGAGAYQYDDYDRNLCKEISQKYDYIITRDDLTYSYFDSAKNVFSGIDMAFFLHEKAVNKGNYALINIMLIKDHLDEIENQRKQLSVNYPNVYVIENTTTPYRNVADYIYCGYWDTLYNTIANASYVVTSQIHTVIVCLCNNVSFKYVGYDSGGEIGRNLLFKKFDFKLEKMSVYDAEYLLSFKEKIEEQKDIATKILTKIKYEMRPNWKGYLAKKWYRDGTEISQNKSRCYKFFHFYWIRRMVK